MKLNNRQKMLLNKAIKYIENTADIVGTEGYYPSGYDGQDFDPGCLADDLKIDFDID